MEIVALYLKHKASAEMTQVDRLRGIRAVGLEGDCQARPSSPRHVLVFDRNVLAALALDERAVRANVVVDGAVDALPSGTVLRAGTLALRLTLACEPCRKLERHRVGLARMLAARRGMLARVIESGAVRVGDSVTVSRNRLRPLDDDWKARVADIVACIPDGLFLIYSELARMAGVHPTFMRSFPRLLARLNAERVVPAKRAGMQLWDGASYWTSRGFYSESAERAGFEPAVEF